MKIANRVRVVDDRVAHGMRETQVLKCGDGTAAAHWYTIRRYSIAQEEYAGLPICAEIADAIRDTIRRACEDMRERCAKLAAQEPEPEGPIPDLVRAEARRCPENLVRGTVRATRSRIAATIRGLEP